VRARAARSEETVEDLREEDAEVEQRDRVDRQGGEQPMNGQRAEQIAQLAPAHPTRIVEECVEVAAGREQPLHRREDQQGEVVGTDEPVRAPPEAQPENRHDPAHAREQGDRRALFRPHGRRPYRDS
jgi:hypothetical protein